MAAPRKKVDVEWVLDRANVMLQHSTTGPEHREGVIVMIEKLLTYTGQYNGFSYLTKVPEGHLPGIADGGPVDETRRVYSMKTERKK
jgi:hypothetical protein